MSFIAKAVSDITAETSRVKLLLSVLFDFRTFRSIIHSHETENPAWTFSFLDIDIFLKYYYSLFCVSL